MTAISYSGPSVFLVGMMGSGKSTVGRRLAQALGRSFIDGDKEIEQRCGVPVSTIFELEGEQGFRDRETQLLEELVQRPGLVLATGGGAVLREENRRLLSEHGTVVYLRASTADLWLRLRHDRVRPLLRTADPRGRIAELVLAREPLYQACASIVIQTGRQPVERVVHEIVERLLALSQAAPEAPA